MAQVTTAEFGAGSMAHRAARKVNVASLLSRIVFTSLALLTVVAVIPHGSSQPWWKALFICVVFTLAIAWLVEGYIGGEWFRESWLLALPLGILAAFSFLQTLGIQTSNENSAGVSNAWNSISADPYQTRFFALELLALILAGVMLFRYATSQRRMRLTINLVICVALATALFGILRQTTSPSVLFGLPFLPADLGYAQFINRNHFAFLMEMGLGLILGLLLGGGIKREQGVIYFAALLVLWTALVLCGSRGGLLAMLGQVVVAALLFGTVFRSNRLEKSAIKIRENRDRTARAHCTCRGADRRNCFRNGLARRRSVGTKNRSGTRRNQRRGRSVAPGSQPSGNLEGKLETLQGASDFGRGHGRILDGDSQCSQCVRDDDSARGPQRLS